MRKIFLILCANLILSLIGLGRPDKAICNQNETVVKIAYLSQQRSLTYLPSMKPNYMKAGYLLAFKDFNNSSWAKANKLRIELVDFEVGTKDVDLIKAFHRAIDSDVLAVVGLDTSKEALLVGELAQKNRLLTLTASAAHDSIGQMGDYVYSGSNSISSTVGTMADFIQKHNKTRILIVSNFDEPYSKKYADVLEGLDIMKNRDIVRIDLPEGRMLSEEYLSKIKEKEYDAIVITTYSYAGVMILNDLIKHAVVSDQPVFVQFFIK